MMRSTIAVGGAGRDHQLDVGMRCAQAAQHGRQVVDQRRGAGADAHSGRANRRGGVAWRPAGALRPCAMRRGVLDQLATGGGGKGAFAQAIDQAHAKPRLELADLQG